MGILHSRRAGRRSRLALAMCLIATSCMPDGADRAPVRVAGAIRFDVSADPSTLDPLLAHVDSGSVEPELARLSFEPFFDVDQAGRDVPALLEVIPTSTNGGVSRDGRTITYRLRRGVRWSDGVAVTSADVLFTLGQILDPANDVSSRAGYDLIDRSSAPDAHTVVVHLSRPWAPAVATFFAYGSTPQFVLPKHVLERQFPLATAAFGGAPTVGDGPFILTKWRRGSSLSYVANPNYWRGRPRSNALEIRVVPDPNTNLALMQAGDIDFNLLAPAQIASLARRPGVAFVRVPTSIVSGIAMQVRHDALSDVAVRRAIAEAIDRDTISKDITLGRYPPASSDEPTFSYAYDASVRQPRFDPAAARRDLDRAGWHVGPGGVRVKDGHVLGLIYALFYESTTAVRTSVFVQRELDDVGIEVETKVYSSNQLFLPDTGTLARGEFDLAYVPWTMGTDPDDGFVYTCDGDKNYMHYCDVDVDRLEERAVTARTPADRKRVYARIARIVARDVPILWLFDATYTYAYRTSLTGFSPNPVSPTWNAWQWHSTSR